MADGSFVARIDELKAHVGLGSIEGTIGFDQVYAHYQHVHVEFRHPRGGQAMYLTQPLAESVGRFGEDMGSALLDLAKSLRGSMIDYVEDIATKSSELTPIEIGDLRLSSQTIVTDNGAEIYHREPDQPRLSEQQLRDKQRILDRADGEDEAWDRERWAYDRERGF